MLAILTTHPIQYQVPIWQALARDGRVPFEVWYLTRHGVEASHDQEFGQKFSWDIDTLSGYPHRFLEVMEGATPTTFRKCRLRERLRDRLRCSNAKALWVQGWQVSAYWQAVGEAKAAGVEVWLRGESNDLAPTVWWKRPLKRVLLGQLFRRVDRFLYIGTANKRFCRKFGVPEERLYSAPYAVDNERFARQAGEAGRRRAEIRRQWKIPEDAFCVLFCGKFIPKKRPMDLVEAARLLSVRNSDLPAPNSTIPKLHLLFVGSGELGNQLRDSCQIVFEAESDQKPEVGGQRPALRSPPSGTMPLASFAGFLNQTEISNAYAAADCLVLPSDYGETWGLVVNEAMASGLPCIVSDRCGCAEDLGRYPRNAIFRCASPSELSGALAKVATSPHAIDTGMGLPSFSETVSTVVQIYPAGTATDQT